MSLIRGAYHLWPKRVGFRNDYCMRCRAQRRSVAVRTFDIGYILWIPIIPVGFWRHWRCCECGYEPHTSPKFRRRLLWRGLYTLIILSIVFWIIPANSDFALGAWVCRIGAPFMAMVFAVQLLRMLRRPSLRTSLARIEPAADTVCPFCATPLVTGFGTHWSCPACGVVRY